MVMPLSSHRTIRLESCCLPASADGLLRDALHQAAVTGNHIGVVIDHLGPSRARRFSSAIAKAHGIGNALTERPGRGLDPGGMAVFGVARRAHAPLAEALDLVERDVGIARQIRSE
jgi:hypothetical protein